MPPNELGVEKPAPDDDGGNDHSHDDAGPSSAANKPQQHQLEPCKPRPRLKGVSFKDVPQKNDAATNEGVKPRNRRRLFRDMSYTTRAIRRDELPGKLERGSKSQPIFAPPNIKRQQAIIGRDSFNADEAEARAVRDDIIMPSSTTAASSSNTTPPPSIRERRNTGSFRGAAERREHRNKGSFAKAGAGISQRFRALYLEEDEDDQNNNNNISSRGNEEGRTTQGQEESQQNNTNQQYYIPPPEEANKSILDAFAQLYSLAFGDLAMWLYGASFGKLLLFFLVLYMMFVYCFVVVLYLVDRHYTNSTCITVLNENEEDGLSVAQHFEFAFELSWTTFTTVGYGNAGPPPELGCYPIRILCSMEAILGMAFVSMCSGLFYAKLLRLLGKASVTFSSTLCVQYGKGLDLGRTGNFRKTVVRSGGIGSLLNFDDGAIEESDEEQYDETKEGGTKEGDAIKAQRAAKRRSLGGTNIFHPFPVIEFRIVNHRANHAPGMKEIWDCEVTAIVQLSIDNDPHEENQEGLDEHQINRAPSQWLGKTTLSADKKSQKVYYKLALKPSSHPYFSRIWFLRHTLDATSPLLRKEVRNMIKDSKHGWDPSFDNYQDIRACLVEFNSLQVMMSGASALSRSEVYAENTYTYEDVCVGWRYMTVCYEEDPDKQEGWQQCKRRKKGRQHFSFGDDTTTRVDLSLIHDIVPQRGGDHEPVGFAED